jgi:hypothetical protein
MDKEKLVTMNKEKLVTIIFPSRGRYDLVKKLLLSIEEKTYNKDWIEVISICDHDDKETLNLFHEMSSQITYDFKFISRKQKEELDLPNDYYDLGLKLASDSYFTWILGNDCEVSTDNWDDNLHQALSHSYSEIFPEIEENKRYFYFKINDDTHWNEKGEILNPYGDESCCFPILSSNYCKDLGEFYPKEIPTWGGDTCLFNFVKNSNKFDIIDAIEIIGIKHYSMHNKRMEQDEISKKVQDKHIRNKVHNTDGSSYDPWMVNFKTIIDKRKKFLWKP